MTATRALVLWSFFLAALTFLLLAWTRDRLQLGLLGGAAAATLAVALLVLATRRDPPERRLPLASLGAPLLALGTAGVVLGVAFGEWLWGPGIGLLLAGLLAWVSEGRR